MKKLLPALIALVSACAEPYIPRVLSPSVHIDELRRVRWFANEECGVNKGKFHKTESGNIEHYYPSDKQLVEIKSPSGNAGYRCEEYICVEWTSNSSPLCDSAWDNNSAWRRDNCRDTGPTCVEYGWVERFTFYPFDLERIISVDKTGAHDSFSVYYPTTYTLKLQYDPIVSSRAQSISFYGAGEREIEQFINEMNSYFAQKKYLGQE